MMQQKTGGLNESKYEIVGSGTLTDDEEVMIPSLDRNIDILNFPDYNIRDEQTWSNTQTRRLAATERACIWGSVATDRQGGPSGDGQ